MAASQIAGDSRTTSSGSLPSGSRATRTSSSLTPDESDQGGHPGAARLLAGRVDVVREDDPAGVPRQQGDLPRREGRAEAGDDVLEAGLVGHQGIGIALDDDRLAE